jgi:hypothetical protein
MGTVRVAVQGVADGNGLFNSENRARIVDANGTVAADWKLSVDTAFPVRVPTGVYTLSGFTVFFGDTMQCVDDAVRPGLQSCFQPTLQPGPGQICGIPIEVTETTLIDALFTNVGRGGCRLEALPAPVPVASD